MNGTPYNAYVVLDTRRKKSDNTYPLKLRIIVDRKSFHIPLRISVDEKHWKAAKEHIASSCKTLPNTTRANIKIQQQKTKALELLAKLDEREELGTLTMQEIKTFLLGGNTKAMVLDFGRAVIAQMKSAGKVGNARVYQTMLNSINTFLDAKDVPFKKITYKWLKQYEAWYLGKGNSLNGLSVHIRTLRALYNRAVKEYPELKEVYPFDKYSIKHEKTRKRAISVEDIEKLKVLKPSQLTTRQKRAKDYFFMSFYLMGASFIDLAFLRISDMQNGRVEYRRRKTGQLHSIKVTPPLQKLLDKYIKKKVGDSYILNVIKGETEEQRYTAARDELRRYNRSLKELAEFAGLSSPLTSYTARHSYATIAKYKGVPTAVISEALGHKSEQVTQVYLDNFDKGVLDKYNEMIIGE